MVYLERAPIYLHLGFDVHLSAGATYTIKEMRSVRYNDKQYFDHPGLWDHRAGDADQARRGALDPSERGAAAPA
jgi:hypothetical protein